MVQKSGDHQLKLGVLSHYLQCFLHSTWLFGISEPSAVGHGFIKFEDHLNVLHLNFDVSQRILSMPQ